MKKIFCIMCLVFSFKLLAVDIDLCSDTVKDKQMEIFTVAEAVLGPEIGQATTMYVMGIGYTNLNCDQYERQLDAVLEAININRTE